MSIPVVFSTSLIYSYDILLISATLSTWGSTFVPRTENDISFGPPGYVAHSDE